MVSTPLFIVGVPRSGTTLLRVMLDSHPNLAAGPECPWISGCYGRITSFRSIYDSLVEDDLGPVHNFEKLSEKEVSSALAQAISNLLDTYAASQGKKRWLEKTPGHIAETTFLTRLFPQSKYIHIIRDGRDVACSSSKLGGNSKKPTMHMGYESKKIPNTRLNALHRWCYWLRKFREAESKYPLDVCEIRYEDLVRQPRLSLEKILEFIEEPWSDNLLNFGEGKHDLPNWEVGSRDVAQKSQISTKSIGVWKTQFTTVERLIAATFADKKLIELGYEPTLDSYTTQKSCEFQKNVHC